MDSNTPLYPINLEEVSLALFNSAAEGLVVVDKKGHILLVNSRLEEMFGRSASELVGSKMEILLPKRMKNSHHRHRDSYFKHPTPRSMGNGMDLTGARSDGQEFPVEVSLNHFEVRGEVLAMALITDISTRKKAEVELEELNQELEERVRQRTQEVQQSQQLFSLIARNFPSGTINVFDRKLNYIFAEGKELYQMGVTSEMLTGTNYLDHLGHLVPEVRNNIKDLLMSVFEGESNSVELKHKGQEYLLNATPLPDEDGTVSQILVVEHNVTPQKNAERKIIEALEKERELNELKSRFVSMASHEFRTPLSTILTSLSLLRRYVGEDHEVKREKHFQRIRNSVHNLTGILNDFLSLDKLEAGVVKCLPEAFDLHELAETLVDELAALRKPGQKIELNWSGEGQVVLDPKMMRNVLTNLLSNAIKYSNSDGTIRLDIARKESSLSIQVVDQGIGIPKADQAHLFSRFFRAGNATNIQGTGLGLNIVRKYLGLMQGTIEFESIEGQGTTFSITLPTNIEDEKDSVD